MQTHLMNTFSRLPFVLSKGKGSLVYDEDGKEYIDFMSGIACTTLGHGHPGVSKAIADQGSTMIHASNWYWNRPVIDLADRLAKATGLESMFLGNSGAEANEGAIKLARKWAHDTYGASKTDIITFDNSFHGRTITTLAATAQDKFHQHFGPFTPGFRYADANMKSVAALYDDSVLAVMVEPIQGEGGVNILGKEFMRGLRKFCDEKGILLIADEVQSGMCRTGHFLACQLYDVKPDIVTLAKGLANGVPIGVVLGSKKLAEVFNPGDHGTTFGGNPFAAKVALVVLDEILSPSFLAEVKRKGEKFLSIAKSWKLPHIVDIRGEGLIVGIEIPGDPMPVMHEAAKAGLLVLPAGKHVVRMVPALNIPDELIEKGMGILKEILLKLA